MQEPVLSSLGGFIFHFCTQIFPRTCPSGRCVSQETPLLWNPHLCFQQSDIQRVPFHAPRTPVPPPCRRSQIKNKSFCFQNGDLILKHGPRLPHYFSTQLCQRWRTQFFPPACELWVRCMLPTPHPVAFFVRRFSAEPLSPSDVPYVHCEHSMSQSRYCSC